MTEMTDSEASDIDDRSLADRLEYYHRRLKARELTDEEAERMEKDVEEFEEIFSEFFDAVSDAIPDEAWEAYRQRLEFKPDEGIYENATLVTPDGEYPAGQVWFWGTSFTGEHMVDIRERNVPPDVDLDACRLEIRNDDGVPILAGPVLNATDPSRTLGRSLCLKIGVEVDDT